jgi:putative phosphoribosyl transferase
MKNIKLNIPVSKKVILRGKLIIPKGAKSLVIFSHGSTRSLFHTRNRLISYSLNKTKTATLETDLLTEKEDGFYKNHFDIDMLADRLAKITSHATGLSALKNLPVGLFGTNTGAASALQAAAKLEKKVYAVVSRSGRPDLANNLNEVKTPALLIVGSLDKEVIRMHEKANSLLNCEKRIEIIDGASYLFSEPGKIKEVAALTTEWFNKHLTPFGSTKHISIN